MKGTNVCPWLIVGWTTECGKSCTLTKLLYVPLAEIGEVKNLIAMPCRCVEGSIVRYNSAGLVGEKKVGENESLWRRGVADSL